MAGSYRDVHLFPVRHHSPRASLVLARWLDRVRPSVVLVEGPSDATHLIDPLTNIETVPPVAILGYRTDGTPASALWPFAAYSPELVALAWAKRAGAHARFIDITTGQSLAPTPGAGEEGGGGGDDLDKESRGTAAPDPAEVSVEEGSLWQHVAERAGHRSFEEFWEASFEAPDHEEGSFRSALIAYADLVRENDRGRDRARDAFMARQIDDTIQGGAPPASIVAVLGAAHAAALAAGDVDPSRLRDLAKTVPTTTTLVPYSFPRLAGQTGYGAGNRAPQFYQRAWDAGGSYRRAALEVLVDFSDHLRLRGFASSLADTIEAYRLACTLAAIRAKAEPGLDEVREATIATMCRGDATHVDSFLWPSVIGKNVGRVASLIGKNSLQTEFWREVDHRRLPRTDEPEEFVLKLGDEVQVATSVFLHRLRIADVPYSTYRGSSVADEPGGFSALTRAREAWQAQWTPATDVALVERIVLGDTLAEVCRRVLGDRLAGARTTADAASVLLESVIASVPETLSTALTACDRLASTDDDLPSLAAACRALSGLVSYGSSREHAELGAAAILPLCVKTFERAVLRVSSAAEGNEEAVAPVKAAMRVLHEIAMAQPAVDKRSWVERARELTHDFSVHPGCSGIAAGLMYLASEIAEGEIALVVERRLSDTLEPERAADFLSGFLEVNALVLVKSRPIVAALDAFLMRIDRARFRDALPVLRRAFSSIGATERRYLVDNLLALRKLGGASTKATGILASRDKERIAALSEDVAAAMDELDDLL